eukprot:Phypoly_transcript_19188.p1 GENE.Phypoly_transcript_19188~~Phypoly_transcript_19188.p1  ORF type:complete len:237 (+),score=49.25 Phypoly_transcript_19188:36-713(+)
MALQFKGLESDPEVFTNFIRKGGIKNYSFHELFSLEELSFIPQPALAVILLYPDESEGGNLIFDTSSTSVAQQEDIYFMKQHNVGNACGTIAVIHSIANNINSLEFDSTSFLKDFVNSTKQNSPLEKCHLMATNEQILKASDSCAREGQTAVAEADDELDYHYICFINKNNSIYQLDGMHAGPVLLQSTSESSFLQDVVQHVKVNFIEKADKIQFNIVALAPNVD